MARVNFVIAPLDAGRITASLARDEITIEVLPETDSTNSLLMNRNPDLTHGHAVFTEVQRAGRGRDGNTWIATPSCNILMSFGWLFPPLCRGGLSLAAGLALQRVVTRLGVTGAGVKWPNDILVDGRKLAGILVETRVGAQATLAVIGIGLNVALAPADRARIATPTVDLQTLLGTAPDRNQLGAQIVNELADACALFATHGLAPFEDGWREHDVCTGKMISVREGAKLIQAMACGITADGALRLQGGDGTMRTVHAGEVHQLRIHEAAG
jgi:BirA family biotin operon repressor/biotin-[acetyl-CoA-carboxylase] ligase